MGFKRGIPKQVTTTRTVTYAYGRHELLKRLRLPEHAKLHVDGQEIIEAADGPGVVLTVEYKEAG